LTRTLPLDAGDIAKASRQTQETHGIRRKAFAVKNENGDKELDDEEDPRTQGDVYCNITLGKRIVWLRQRSDALAIIEAVSRLQTRRTARQVGEIAVALYEYGDTIEDLDESMQEIETRFSKIVGIRRVT
jgi:hypothetical protein